MYYSNYSTDNDVLFPSSVLFPNIELDGDVLFPKNVLIRKIVLYGNVHYFREMYYFPTQYCMEMYQVSSKCVLFSNLVLAGLQNTHSFPTQYLKEMCTICQMFIIFQCSTVRGCLEPVFQVHCRRSRWADAVDASMTARSRLSQGSSKIKTIKNLSWKPSTMFVLLDFRKCVRTKIWTESVSRFSRQ